MKIVFRTDASLLIGTGHVMRCLTLAEALRARGAECHFICREHPGNLLEHLRCKGYAVHALLPAEHADGAPSVSVADLAHARWLGGSQAEDAAECAQLLRELQPDWLVVDHYALDARWERELKAYCQKLMVIDDLADRPHQCDLLLDQTYGRACDEYSPWVSPGCTVLCGAQYALLRQEFCALRASSLQKRASPQLQCLLISMGGVDRDNVTGQVLDALRSSSLPEGCRVVVVMGASAPWLAEVHEVAANMPWSTEVRVGVENMAQLMADSDLAIGAAGSTSWERCCLGLPAVMLVLADNQRKVAQGLAQAGAVLLLQDATSIAEALPALLDELMLSTGKLSAMSRVAAAIVDGRGVESMIAHLESFD